MQPFTKDQISYRQRVEQVCAIAHDVMRRHNRFDRVTLDGGMGMLPDSADHTLLIPTGLANVEVAIFAHWFRDPPAYHHAISAAVEAAFAAAERVAQSAQSMRAS
jgi:hypothetical protein